MTLQEFISSKKVLITQEEMQNFFDDSNGEEYLTPIHALYVYDGVYYIEETTVGVFHLHIEGQEYIGTLEELEEILFLWSL